MIFVRGEVRENFTWACKEAEITVETYYRWRKEYGGLKPDQAKRLKELVRENSKLKRLVAQLSLGAATLCGGACARGVPDERTACVPAAGAVDAAVQRLTHG